MEAFITYPNKMKNTHYCFKLNTDDYPCPKHVDNYLKQLNVKFKRTRQNHATKLIGWHVYKIEADKRIRSFEENVKFVESLFLKGTNLVNQ